MANSPDEAGQFSRDPGNGHGWLFTSRDQRPIAGTQPVLCLPCDIPV
jgi:hypothetical protein